MTSTLFGRLNHRLLINGTMALLLAVAAVPQLHAITREIDLAASVNVDTREEPGTSIRLRVVNRAPSVRYVIRTELRMAEIKPFEDFIKTRTLEQKGPTCSDLKEAVKSLLEEKEETKIPAALGRVSAAEDSCSDTATLVDAKAAIAQTSFELDAETILPAGRELRAVVERIENDKVTKTWTRTFRTEAPGQWNGLSTLALVPSRDDEYFLRQQTDGTFQIARKHDRSTADFVPAVLFTWTPAGRENDKAVWSIGGRLGFESSNPIVLLGGAVTFFRNLGISGGLVVHQQQQLAGVYDVGQTVKENLTAQQLHETTYRPNVYFGFHYRFGSSRNLKE